MAGRKPKYQEFLLTLHAAIGGSTSDFAEAIGKQVSNVSQYLSGAKQPGKSVIRSAIAYLSEWNVSTDRELGPIPPLQEIPTEGGIYSLYDSAGRLLYLGQASNLRNEISQTLNRPVNFPIRMGPNLSRKGHPRYKEIAERLSVYIVPSPRLRHNLEALLLRVYANEGHNNKLGAFR